MPSSPLSPSSRRASRAARAVLCLVLVLSGAALGPVAPAAAAGCPRSGGATIPAAAAKGDVVFRGGGWGHGLGMSQYGAQGAARLGCTAEQILTRYYTGTQVVSRPMPDTVQVRLLAAGNRVDVTAVQGTLTWTLDGCVVPPPSGWPSPGPTPTTPPPLDPTPGPTPGPTVTASPPPCPPTQPQGARWQLRPDLTGGQFAVYDRATTPPTLLWQGGSAQAPLMLAEAGNVAQLTTWRGGSVFLERWVRWDRTQFTLNAGALDAVQRIETSSAGSAMDKYLWGIAEMPASFPPAALQAQAIAARTYAAKRADRVLLPTPADQNWTGWKKETEGTGGQWGLAWKAAVDATSGRVVADAAGRLIDALYSSSMGGQTEDERYVWGVAAPFLRAVDDSAWDAASSNPPQNRSWAVGMSWRTVARKLGFSRISTISVPPRGSPARTAGVKVVGIRAGRLTTSYLTGWDVRQALGLLSPGFTIVLRRLGGPHAQPLVGDWDGDGDDDPGWFRDGRVALRMTAGGTHWVKRFRYGAAGDVAVVGDWDGDGDDDLGVFRDGRWLLRAGLTGGQPTRVVRFGRAGDRPVVGSWTGTTVGIGVVRGGTWLLRRTTTSGPATSRFRFGRPGDEPVVGSWNAGPRTGIGVERDGRWLLRNRRSAGPASVRVRFGPAGDSSWRAVVGDWDGDGVSTPATVRGRVFGQRLGLGRGAPTRTVRFAG